MRRSGVLNNGFAFFEFKKSMTDPDIQRVEWDVDNPILVIPSETAITIVRLGYGRNLTQDEVDQYNDSEDFNDDAQRIADQKKRDDEAAAQKKLDDEAAAQRIADQKKRDDEAAQKKLEDEAAQKKLEDVPADEKPAEEQAKEITPPPVPVPAPVPVPKKAADSEKKKSTGAADKE